MIYVDFYHQHFINIKMLMQVVSVLTKLHFSVEIFCIGDFPISFTKQYFFFNFGFNLAYIYRRSEVFLK